MNNRQRDAILAGLRLLQQRLDDGENIADIADIYTDTGRHEGLRSEEIDALCENLNTDSYTQLEVEHCIRAENRWGETFIEAVHDPERVKLSDVLDRFWSVYGRRRDGKADCLHDTSSRGRAMEVAAALSICAFNSIPIVDRSPEDLQRSEHDYAPGGPGTA